MDANYSLQSTNSRLHAINTVLAVVAACMLIAVCSGDSDSATKVHSMPFMVLTDSIVIPGAAISVSICLDIGFKAACPSLCGSDTCLSPDGSGSGSGSGSDSGTFSSFVYSSLLEHCPIPIPPEGATDFEIQELKDVCTTIQQCVTGGNVTFSFAVIACLSAVAAAAVCFSRFKEESSMHVEVVSNKAKHIATALSVIACVASFVAYCGLQWCTHGFDDILKNTIGSAPSDGTIQVTVSTAPGTGGILVILSFVIFVIMTITNVYAVPETDALAQQDDSSLKQSRTQA